MKKHLFSKIILLVLLLAIVLSSITILCSSENNNGGKGGEKDKGEEKEKDKDKEKKDKDKDPSIASFPSYSDIWSVVFNQMDDASLRHLSGVNKAFRQWALTYPHYDSWQRIVMFMIVGMRADNYDAFLVQFGRLKQLSKDPKSVDYSMHIRLNGLLEESMYLYEKASRGGNTEKYVTDLFTLTITHPDCDKQFLQEFIFERFILRKNYTFLSLVGNHLTELELKWKWGIWKLFQGTEKESEELVKVLAVHAFMPLAIFSSLMLSWRNADLCCEPFDRHLFTLYLSSLPEQKELPIFAFNLNHSK